MCHGVWRITYIAFLFYNKRFWVGVGEVWGWFRLGERGIYDMICNIIKYNTSNHLNVFESIVNEVNNTLINRIVKGKACLLGLTTK